MGKVDRGYLMKILGIRRGLCPVAEDFYQRDGASWMLLKKIEENLSI